MSANEASGPKRAIGGAAGTHGNAAEANGNLDAGNAATTRANPVPFPEHELSAALWCIGYLLNSLERTGVAELQVEEAIALHAP